MKNLVSTFIFVVGFLIVITGMRIPGSPYPDDISSRFIIIFVAILVMALGLSAMWFSTWIEDWFEGK